MDCPSTLAPERLKNMPNKIIVTVKKLDNKKEVVQLIEKFENFFLFVQKSNDLDSFSSALALCRLIQLNVPHAKKIRIFGITVKNSFVRFADENWREFLPEENLHNEIPPNTIGITVDVNNAMEILHVNRLILKKVDCILKIDHHTTPIEFCETAKPNEQKILDEKLFEYIEHLQSCSEVIWNLIKEANGKKTKLISEVIYIGVCSENSFLMNKGTTPETLRVMAEIMEEGVDFNKLQDDLGSLDKLQWLLFTRLIQTAIGNRNMVCLNLTPDIAYEYYPEYFLPNKKRSGFIAQKGLITFPLRLINRLTNANTIVYVHYSLFKTFQSKDKYVFILNRNNDPEITEMLLRNKFRQHRERFSRAFKEYEIQMFINAYSDILSK